MRLMMPTWERKKKPSRRKVWRFFKRLDNGKMMIVGRVDRYPSYEGRDTTDED